MRRRAIAALVLLAACSSSTSSTSSTPTSTPAAAPAAPPPSTPAAASTTTTTTTAPNTTTSLPHGRTVAELLATGRPIVLAHTGGEDEFPASTMFAFGESMKAQVDVLDLNVQLTRDGVLVVHHDDSVDGATNGTGKLAELTYAEIAPLDDAYWFTADCVCRDRPDTAYVYRGIRTGRQPPPPGYTADDFAMPTLRQVIERWPTSPLNIEIKGSGPPAVAAAKELAAELTELHRLDASVVASFDDAIVDAFHALAPAVEVSPGLAATTAWVLDGTPLPPGQRILQLPPAYNGTEVLTPAVIARAHAAGYVIWEWPNDHALENDTEYTRMLDRGIDGLNINYPATGVAAAVRWAAQTAGKRPSAGCTAAPAAPGERTAPFSAAGLDGTVIEHLPASYDGRHPLPLVVDLHGYAEPADVQRQFSGLAALGEERRFVTLLPDITRAVPRWDTTLGSADVAWAGALLDDAAARLCIDLARLYVAGMSNGAMMSSTIGCALGDRLAAIAPVAGITDPAGCDPKGAMPVIAFHGTADGFLAYTGGAGPQVAELPNPNGEGTIGTAAVGALATPPVPDVVGAWAARNGCAAGAPLEQAVAADVTELSWNCPGGAETELYRVDGGGHAWPGSTLSHAAAAIVGPTTMSISASELIWDFFRAHSRRG